MIARLPAPTCPSRQVSICWRVSAINQEGLATQTSAVQKFEFGLHPTPCVANCGGPTQRSAVDLSHAQSEPELHWKATSGEDGAEEYEVTIISSQGTLKRKVTTNKLALPIDPAKTPEGTLQWSVRARDRLGHWGLPGALQTLQVTYGAPLQAPEALSPEVQ